VARVPEHTIRESSLAGFDGLGIDLTGLDHDDRNSYRAIAARGWAPAHGTQICPACLADGGSWRTVWRLLIVTACTTHGTQLIASCPSCGRRFRDQHHSHLRRVGAATVCGNPLGQGPTRQCGHDLTTITTHPADPATLATQQRVDAALQGQQIRVLGQPATPAAYLTDLRHLTTLLLHLAEQPGALRLADWAVGLHAETARRTGTRGPRWGLRPPDNPLLRGRAIGTADGVLTGRDLEEAARSLVPWIDLTPRTIEGALGWLADRTVMTPTLTRLVMAARASHRRLSHHLDTLDPDRQNGAMVRLDTRLIPQVIPEPLYREHLVGAFDSGEVTVRLFASLCLARMKPDVTSWAAAAHALGLPPDVGVLTGRICSSSTRIDNNDWTDRLHRVATDLPGQDYRLLEVKLWGLNNQTGWFDQWRRGCRPTTPRRHDHVRPGLAMGARRSRPPRHRGRLERPAADTRHRAAYRQFESSLNKEQRTRLAQTLAEPSTARAASTPGTTGKPIGEMS